MFSATFFAFFTLSDQVLVRSESNFTLLFDPTYFCIRLILSIGISSLSFKVNSHSIKSTAALAIVLFLIPFFRKERNERKRN